MAGFIRRIKLDAASLKLLPEQTEQGAMESGRQSGKNLAEKNDDQPVGAKRGR